MTDRKLMETTKADGSAATSAGVLSFRRALSLGCGLMLAAAMLFGWAGQAQANPQFNFRTCLNGQDYSNDNDFPSTELSLLADCGSLDGGANGYRLVNDQDATHSYGVTYHFGHNADTAARIVGITATRRLVNYDRFQAYVNVLTNDSGWITPWTNTNPDSDTGWVTSTLGTADLGLGGAKRVWYILRCIYPPSVSCQSTDSDGTPRPLVGIRNVRYTVEDMSTPSASVGGTLFDGAGHRGTVGFNWNAADGGSGIAKAELKVNGSVADSQDWTGNVAGGCNVGIGVSGNPSEEYAASLVPCATSVTNSRSVDTTASPFVEGANSVQACYEDFASHIDPLENTTQCTSPVTVTVDNVAAAPEITAKPADPTNSTSASFEFTGEEGASFECRLDGGALASCSSPKSYSGLAEGSHTFSVRQTDALGNVSPEASYTWQVDVTAPAAPSITAKPADPTNSTSASFSFTGESGASFECKLDGGSFAACSPPKAYLGLGEGSHTFAVRQADPAGNVSAATSYTWQIDTTAPGKPTITDKPASVSSNATARFAWTGAEAGGSFECKLDAGAFAACTSPKQYNELTPGPHTFSVRQRDAAGNGGEAESYDWIAGAPGIEGCNNPMTTVADGHAGDTYVTIRHEKPSATEDHVCVTAAGPEASFGGKVVIGMGAEPGTPTVDDQGDQCATADENDLPPHPPLGATVGDGTEVPQVSAFVDAYANTDTEEVWVCATVTETQGGSTQTFSKRVKIPLPDGTNVPDVEFVPYNTQPVPAAEPGDPANPSSACRQTPGGEYERVLNMDLADEDTHVWLDTRQASESRAQICTRIEGPAAVGGLFEVDAGLSGFDVIADTDGDLTPCTLLVAEVPAANLEVTRSPATDNPASICVSHAPTNTQQRVFAGTEGGVEPAVSFTPDPGTPLPPLP